MTIDLIPNIEAKDIAGALMLARIPFSVDYPEGEGAIFDFPPEHREHADKFLAALQEALDHPE